MARIVREQYPSRLEERQINATLLLYAQVIDIRRDRPWRQWKGTREKRRDGKEERADVTFCDTESETWAAHGKGRHSGSNINAR